MNLNKFPAPMVRSICYHDEIRRKMDITHNTNFWLPASSRRFSDMEDGLGLVQSDTTTEWCGSMQAIMPTCTQVAVLAPKDRCLLPKDSV